MIWHVAQAIALLLAILVLLAALAAVAMGA